MHLILQNGIGLASFHFRNLYTSGSRVLYLPSTNSITLPFWLPPNSQLFITILKFFALHVPGPTLAKIAKSLSRLMLTYLPLVSLVTLDILSLLFSLRGGKPLPLLLYSSYDGMCGLVSVHHTEFNYIFILPAIYIRKLNICPQCGILASKRPIINILHIQDKAHTFIIMLKQSGRNDN